MSKEEKDSKVRYVPIEIDPSYNDSENIDLVETLSTLYKNWRTILKIIFAFFLLGIFVALTSVEEYSSEVKLQSETVESLPLGGLGGLAEQFGLMESIRGSEEGISSSLYPSIIKSNVFIAELMNYQIVTPELEEPITVSHYFENYVKKSILMNLVIAPIKLKDWIMSVIQKDKDVYGTIEDLEKQHRLTRMSDEEWEILREIRDRLTTNLDSDTQVFSVSVKMQDPVVAADLADEVVEMLSEYITDKRTEKARRNVEFIQERFEEAKKEFENAQKELASFNDANRGQLSALAQTEEQILQSRYNLNFNLYNTLAEQLEQARIKLQEDTPVITIIEPAAVPYERSEPNRILLLFIFSFAGLFIGLGFVLSRNYWLNIKNEVQNNS